MASVTDMVNEAKQRLDQIVSNTNDTNQRLDGVNQRLDTANAGLSVIANKLQQLEAIESAGFANLSGGLAVLIDRQAQTNALLDANNRQNETIICWLTTQADLQCRQLRRLNDQLAAQRAILEMMEQMRDTMELVYGTETVEVLRRKELQSKIEVCCPPPQAEPEFCYTGCQSPRIGPYQPTPTNWRPLSQVKGPVG